MMPVQKEYFPDEIKWEPATCKRHMPFYMEITYSFLLCLIFGFRTSCGFLFLFSAIFFIEIVVYVYSKRKCIRKTKKSNDI